MPRAGRRAPPALPTPPPPALDMQPLPLAHYIANPTPAFTEHLALSGSCRKCPGKHPDPGKKGGKGEKRGKGKKVKFADPIEEVEGEEGEEDEDEEEDGAEEEEEGDEEEEADEWPCLEGESEEDEEDVTIEEQDQPDIPDAQNPPTQNASKASQQQPTPDTNNTNSANLPPQSTADEHGLVMLLQAIQAVENVHVEPRTLTPAERDATIGLLGLREWRGGDEVFGERVVRG